MNKIKKMIETLEKMAKDGRETPTSNRLHWNLVKVSKETKHITTDMLEMICKKQSMENCLVATVKVLDMVATNKSNKRALNAEKKAAEVATLPAKKIVRGYYTDDIYQEWIDENNPQFDIETYEAFQRCRKSVLRGH